VALRKARSGFSGRFAGRTYAAATDGATRWRFIRVFNAKTAANARRVPRALEQACPIRIQTTRKDNGEVFTDRLFGLRRWMPLQTMKNWHNLKPELFQKQP